MTEQQKTDLILFAAICGYLEKGILELNLNLSEKILAKNLSIQGYQIYNSLVSKLSNSERKSILKKVDTCEIAVIPPGEVKKRVGEKELTVKRAYLDELTEQALTVCETCTRDYKRCALRKTLKKLEVAACHDEKGRCEFKA